MAPSLDQLESRQLLSASPVHVHAEALRNHHAAVVEHAPHAHHASSRDSAAAATPDAATTGFSDAATPSGTLMATVATPDVATTRFSVAATPSGTLVATAAIADNDIWAVGYEYVGGTSVYVPVAEHFNGTSWSSVPTPALSGGGQFWAVGGAASNDVWAVGSNEFGTLIEHWNGTAWSVVTAPNDGTPAAVAALSANDVLAAGANGVLQWNGTAWSVLPDTPAISAISADSPTDVWALGSGNAGSALLHSTNGGTTWSQVVATGGNSLTAISPTDVWITTGSVAKVFPNGIYEQHNAGFEQWNGTTLSVVAAAPAPAPPTSTEFTSTGFHGITAVSANDIVAVGVVKTLNANGAFLQSTPLVEQWNGTSWSIVSIANSPSGELLAATALSDGTVVAVGPSDLEGPTGIPALTSPSIIVQN